MKTLTGLIIFGVISALAHGEKDTTPWWKKVTRCDFAL